MGPVSVLVYVTRNRRSKYPHSFSNNCPLPFIFVTQTVSFADTTAKLPSYGAGRLNSAIPMSGFADHIECSSPTAVRSRTINAPWPMCCGPASPCVDRKSTLSDQMVHIEAIKDSEGNIVGAVNCFQDVTERKHAENAALRLAAIVESSYDAIVGKGLDGIITSWNAGAERTFGYAAEEIIDKSIAILIPPDHQKEEEAIIERIRRGQRVESFETVRRRKDGSLIDVSLTISPVKNF
jgi:PAS domain S-box-containing protein